MAQHNHKFIVWLQQQLGVIPTGIADANTHKALLAYQTSLGLKATSTATKETVDALRAGKTPQDIPPLPHLRPSPLSGTASLDGGDAGASILGRVPLTLSGTASMDGGAAGSALSGVLPPSGPGRSPSGPQPVWMGGNSPLAESSEQAYKTMMPNFAEANDPDPTHDASFIDSISRAHYSLFPPALPGSPPNQAQRQLGNIDLRGGLASLKHPPVVVQDEVEPDLAAPKSDKLHFSPDFSEADPGTTLSLAPKTSSANMVGLPWESQSYPSFEDWLMAHLGSTKPVKKAGGGGIGGLSDTDIEALVGKAYQLGVSPNDLYAAINYESARTFSPSIMGGTGGKYMGLIQFSPRARQEYGATPDQTFSEQIQSVGDYLADRGLQPGMGLPEIYSIINAGSLENGQPRWHASDGHGTVRSHVQAIQDGFYPSTDLSQSVSSAQDPWNAALAYAGRGTTPVTPASSKQPDMSFMTDPSLSYQQRDAQMDALTDVSRPDLSFLSDPNVSMQEKVARVDQLTGGPGIAAVSQEASGPARTLQPNKPTIPPGPYAADQFVKAIMSGDQKQIAAAGDAMRSAGTSAFFGGTSPDSIKGDIVNYIGKVSGIPGVASAAQKWQTVDPGGFKAADTGLNGALTNAISTINQKPIAPQPKVTVPDFQAAQALPNLPQPLGPVSPLDFGMSDTPDILDAIQGKAPADKPTVSASKIAAPHQNPLKSLVQSILGHDSPKGGDTSPTFAPYQTTGQGWGYHTYEAPGGGQYFDFTP